MLIVLLRELTIHIDKILLIHYLNIIIYNNYKKNKNMKENHCKFQIMTNNLLCFLCENQYHLLVG